MKEVKVIIRPMPSPGPAMAAGEKASSGRACQPRASSTATSNTASTPTSAAISTPSTFDDRSMER